MKDSFIGKEEINDFLNTIDENKESSLFKYGEAAPKNSSVRITNDSIITSESKLIRETPYSFSNGMQWVTFAPVAKKFKEIYGVDTFQVDLFSMIYMIIYPVVNFPSSYIIDNKSVRLGITISALLTILGAGLKSFLNTSIFLAYAGQLLSAVAQPLILNSPGKIASTWFRDERRVLATSICCLSNTIGIIFGFIFPTFFVDQEMKSDEYKTAMKFYLIGELIITGALCLPVIFFFKSKPKIPPSKSQNNYQSPPLLTCLKLMFKNKNFIKLLAMFTFILGYFNLYGTIVNEYFSKYGLTDNQTSYVGGVANFMAIIGCLIVSAILDKLKNYKRAFLILNTFGLICHLTMTISLEYFYDYNYIILMVLWTFCSMSIIPIYTCSMDFVVELTYPVGESISGGLIMTCSQISGILAIVICDYFMEYFPNIRYLSNSFSSLFLLISFISIYSLEEKLLRHQKDISDDQVEEKLI